ncbi:MAG: DNA-directed RNA polymerase subunit alpha [Planctomycetes bacterium]|nr:DNA-directed RNA polymerase subunit alpha [Planctomycetota bacterium]MBI3847023.1 DNA-directed RNA polymerase subunit alpha [Planctomycetota bacterium]
MRIRWRNFELPTQVIADRDTLSSTYGRFTVEPFERSFGTTVANGVRRVLLSSLEGTAVTTVKITGVVHEFSTIAGVYEDVTDIVLNVKQLVVKLAGDEPVTLKIQQSKKGPVTGGDIQGLAGAEIVNPDLHICTLTEKVDFGMELTVKKGRGYVTAEENAVEGQEIGIIPIDSIFSPVRRVKFRTENTRVGKLTNYDKVILDVWTNGAITPEMALVEAAKIYRKHLNPFVHYFELGPVLPRADERSDGIPMAEFGGANAEKLNRPISDLDLSVRASNCLSAANIRTIGELVQRTEEEMLEIRNFGRTSLKEVKKKLVELGLSLRESADVAKKSGE